MIAARRAFRMASFLDLGFDVSSQIIHQLLVEGIEDVISLSLVSRQMRQLTLPAMFTNVQWPLLRAEQDSSEFFPASLWPYIKKMEFVYRTEALWGTRLHMAAMELLSKALPEMPNIVTFAYAIQRFSPNLALIEALAASPSIHSLHISTPFLIHNASTLFRSFHGVRRLVIQQAGQATLYSAPPIKRALSIQCVANIIQGCSETLEVLEIPGEYCPLSDLSSRMISLPVLRKFDLKGYPPFESDSQKYPLWRVIHTMPRLDVLGVHCKLRIIGASPHRYQLLPPEVSPTPDEFTHFSSQIESITISNPSLSDQFFQRLPFSLKCLVLDFIPGWENMLSSGDTLAYHKPDKVLHFLRSIYISEFQVRPSLEQLCIKMGWCGTPELLKSIYQIFPHLRALELQGIRYFNRAEDPESDMDGIVSIIQKFEYLHTLKLAVELQEDSYKDNRSKACNIGSVDEAMQRWANIFGERTKSLRRLAFEKRRHTGKGYGRRAAIGMPLWVWFFPNHSRQAGSDLMRRSEESFNWNLARMIPPSK